jgi:hypothetical protein
MRPRNFDLFVIVALITFYAVRAVHEGRAATGALAAFVIAAYAVRISVNAYRWNQNRRRWAQFTPSEKKWAKRVASTL